MPDKNIWINNKDDIILFTSVVSQIKPESVIDIGMFLQRMGAVSTNSFLEDDAAADGVFAECERRDYGGVYDVLYRKKCTLDDFVNPHNPSAYEITDRRYNLAVMMKSSPIIPAEHKPRIWKWLQKHSEYVLADTEDFGYVEALSKRPATREISVEGAHYMTVAF